MKIFTLSDLQLSGGAAVACNRISTAVQSCGANVFSSSSDGVNTETHQSLFLGRKFELLIRLFGSTLPFTFLEELQAKELHKQLSIILRAAKPDLINTHNLHSAGWPISLIKCCLNFAPVVWTLHDCWSFLGSFYPTHSPPPSVKLKGEIIRFWNSIKSNPPKHKLYAATPSLWMKNEALGSHWAHYKVEAIHNPVPDSFFTTRDRSACKKALSLNETKTSILCIAGNLEEERKGGPILRDILAEDWGQDVEFILIGNGYTAAHNSGYVKYLGFVRDEITLQIAYSAADILLHPAPIDNLPNTVAESMSCGTPVLAFGKGGLPEMVEPERSGWLVQNCDGKEIISKLKSILDSKSYFDLQKTSKSTAYAKFNSSKVGKTYQNLFNSCSVP